MKKFLLLIAALVATSAVASAQDTWTVAGTGAALNENATWAPGNAANDMTSTDGVNYTLLVENKDLETGVNYEFKVVKNHAWSEAYPSQNYSWNVAETAKYNVTYTFNTDTKDVAVSTEKVGEAGEVSHIYSIAGSASNILGANWDQTNTGTEMTNDGNGLYTWTSAEVEVEAGFSFEYKIVADHNWSIAYPSSNASYSVAEAGTYTFTFTFDENSKAVNCVANKVGGEDPVEQDVFMKHPWGTGADADWAWKQLTFNENTGFYTITDLFGGIGVNVNNVADDANATWVPVDQITLEGNPAVGDECIFSYDPANGHVTISKTTPTAINDINVEAAKAVKFIENGQLIIVKGGIRYNVMGQKL